MSTLLEYIQGDVLNDGVVDEAEVNQIRAIIQEDGVVDRAEADALFALNDATTGKDNHESWKTLFVELLTQHVLADETSPNVLDEDEAAYLIAKIQGDGQVDDMELSLMVKIIETAQSTPESFQTFVIESLTTNILADGVIDSQEVESIRTVIYGQGGADGAGISRSEADWLFKLNDETSGNENDASWNELFVDAIYSHVMEDENSPNAIDDDEGNWLATSIGEDGNVDENEKALLSKIKANATSVPSKVSFLFSMNNIT